MVREIGGRAERNEFIKRLQRRRPDREEAPITLWGEAEIGTHGASQETASAKNGPRWAAEIEDVGPELFAEGKKRFPKLIAITNSRDFTSKMNVKNQDLEKNEREFFVNPKSRL